MARTTVHQRCLPSGRPTTTTLVPLRLPSAKTASCLQLKLPPRLLVLPLPSCPPSKFRMRPQLMAVLLWRMLHNS